MTHGYADALVLLSTERSGFEKLFTMWSYKEMTILPLELFSKTFCKHYDLKKDFINISATIMGHWQNIRPVEKKKSDGISNTWYQAIE